MAGGRDAHVPTRAVEMLAQLELEVKELNARAQPSAYAARQAARQAQRDAGNKTRGREPQPPSAAPDPKTQYNFTDPQSRIMKAGSGAHFERS